MKPEDVVAQALGKVFTAAQLEVRIAGKVEVSGAWGCVDPEAGSRPTRNDTLFDIASVTKLFTTAAFMTLVREGRVSLDTPVSLILPEFSGLRPIRAYENPLKPGAFVEVSPAGAPPGGEAVDAGAVSFRDLLSHSSGLPAWRPLNTAGSPQAAREMALSTFFSYPTHSRVVYSDLGLMLTGFAIEKITGSSLAAAVRARVLEPLGLGHTRYFPAPADESAIAGLDIAPAELCAWRKRRIVGEVHDENAASLGGVAGHAGLFSCASDLAAFGQCFLDGGAPILDSAIVAEMSRLQSEDGAIRRGIGFALWSPDSEAASNPLGRRSFGHLGFTGISLWMDPERALVVACATNRIYYGRDAAGITAFRVELHKAIAEM
jgi:serine-type D-Ala-D-Ala carboxypeptidase